MQEIAAVVDLIVKLLTIGTIIGATGVTLYKLGRMTAKFESIGVQQGIEITSLKVAFDNLSSDMKTGLAKIADVLLSVALQRQSIQSHDERIARLERAWDELRHGEGFTLPFEMKKQYPPASGTPG